MIPWQQLPKYLLTKMLSQTVPTHLRMLLLWASYQSLLKLTSTLSKATLEAFLTAQLAAPTLIMESLQSAMGQLVAKNTSSLGTHGVHHGEKAATLELQQAGKKMAEFAVFFWTHHTQQFDRILSNYILN